MLVGLDAQTRLPALLTGLGIQMGGWQLDTTLRIIADIFLVFNEARHRNGLHFVIFASMAAFTLLITLHFVHCRVETLGFERHIDYCRPYAQSIFPIE